LVWKRDASDEPLPGFIPNVSSAAQAAAQQLMIARRAARCSHGRSPVPDHGSRREQGASERKTRPSAGSERGKVPSASPVIDHSRDACSLATRSRDAYLAKERMVTSEHTMKKGSVNPVGNSRSGFRELEQLPNIGSAVAADLRRLAIRRPQQLVGRDPYRMYDDLCRVTGKRHDPCVLDTFIAVVRFMGGEAAKPWWTYTAERKRVTKLGRGKS
jgi:hypothetical protein